MKEKKMTEIPAFKVHVQVTNKNCIKLLPFFKYG